VYRRYDPTLLPCLEGPIDSLEARVIGAWDNLDKAPNERLGYMRQVVKGVCAHLSTIPLFQPEQDVSRRSRLSKQKAGIAFFTREPPAAASNPAGIYRGADVNDRLEATVSLFTLTALFGIAGYRPATEDLVVPESMRFQYRPYYSESFSERAPDRRSCAQLATAAMRFREYMFDSQPGRVFKPIAMTPVQTTPSLKRPARKKSKKAHTGASAPVSEVQEGAAPAHFSSADIRTLAGMPGEQEGHPAAAALCWFAARIRKFSSVEFIIPCLLQRCL